MDLDSFLQILPILLGEPIYNIELPTSFLNFFDLCMIFVTDRCVENLKARSSDPSIVLETFENALIHTFLHTLRHCYL